MVLNGMIQEIGYIFGIFAIQFGKTGIAAGIRQSNFVFHTLLNFIFLSKVPNIYELIAMVVALFGIFFMCSD